MPRLGICLHQFLNVPFVSISTNCRCSVTYYGLNIFKIIFLVGEKNVIGAEARIRNHMPEIT